MSSEIKTLLLVIAGIALWELVVKDLVSGIKLG